MTVTANSICSPYGQSALRFDRARATVAQALPTAHRPREVLRGRGRRRRRSLWLDALRTRVPLVGERVGRDLQHPHGVHVAILSALWQFGVRWRAATVLIGLSYALLMVYRHYHAPSDIALTAAAMLPNSFSSGGSPALSRQEPRAPARPSAPPDY